MTSGQLQRPSSLQAIAVMEVLMDRIADLRPLTDLDRALTAFLADHSKFEQFHKTALSYVRQCSRRSGAGLPSDVLDEIANETFSYLLERTPASFDASRGSAHAFIRFEVRHAARRVRASYAPPGTVTRPAKKTALAEVTASSKLQQETDPDRHEARAFGAVTTIEAAIRAQHVLETAPPDIRQVLVGQFFGDETLRSVSTSLGVSAGTMSRKVARFFNAVRLEAA